MIYLKVRGRAGNQFFQFAAVKAFQEKFYPEEKIAIDFSDLKKLGSVENGFTDSLKDFHAASFYETTDKIEATLVQKTIVFLMKIPNAFLRLIGFSDRADQISYNFEKKIQPFINWFGVYYMIHGYTTFNKSKAKNKIIYGNFESPNYFDCIKPEIQELYTPVVNEAPKNIDLYREIKTTESVCVTIRRGDFVDNKEFAKVHYICTPEYFYKGIDEIKNRVSNPVIVVFSDDIQWVKENMDFGVKTLYEDGTDTIWEKIRLMYSCKHFVISNSTFSWWAQYLSRNKNKIVVAPKRWKNIGYKKDTSQLDIYQKDWIRI